MHLISIFMLCCYAKKGAVVTLPTMKKIRKRRRRSKNEPDEKWPGICCLIQDSFFVCQNQQPMDILCVCYNLKFKMSCEHGFTAYIHNAEIITQKLSI